MLHNEISIALARGAPGSAGPFNGREAERLSDTHLNRRALKVQGLLYKIICRTNDPDGQHGDGRFSQDISNAGLGTAQTCGMRTTALRSDHERIPGAQDSKHGIDQLAVIFAAMHRNDTVDP